VCVCVCVCVCICIYIGDAYISGQCEGNQTPCPPNLTLNIPNNERVCCSRVFLLQAELGFTLVGSMAAESELHTPASSKQDRNSQREHTQSLTCPCSLFCGLVDSMATETQLHTPASSKQSRISQCEYTQSLTCPFVLIFFFLFRLSWCAAWWIRWRR